MSGGIPLAALLMSLALCALSANGHSAEATVFDPSLSGALQKSLEQLKDTLRVEHLSASLYVSDRCHWEGATGLTRQTPRAPVDPSSLYGFGSVTKTFVAAIILQLAEEGRLGLEDPLGRWLPRHPRIDPSITVRRLLNHGSGLSGYYGSRRYWSRIEADPDRVWRPEDALEHERPPQSAGDATPRYTNTNYILLGMIVEAVTGNSLARELRSRITGPLRLESTRLPKKDFNPERWADSSRLSPSLYSSVWAAGAIASTPRDIAKWSHTLYSGRFLQPASMDAMRVTEPRRLGGAEIPMGLGVWKFEKDGQVAWGHGGNFKPFRSAAVYFPALDLGVAYSFEWTASANQFLPAKQLMQIYARERPADVSMCFDP